MPNLPSVVGGHIRLGGRHAAGAHAGHRLRRVIVEVRVASLQHLLVDLRHTLLLVVREALLELHHGRRLFAAGAADTLGGRLEARVDLGRDVFDVRDGGGVCARIAWAAAAMITFAYHYRSVHVAVAIEGGGGRRRRRYCAC